MIRYMDELASTATDAYAQKHTCIAVWNHTPVSGIPYWQRLTRIVPVLGAGQCLVLQRLPRAYETTWNIINTETFGRVHIYSHKQE
jgi:hypothetical protein